MNLITNYQMIKIEQTDKDKETVTYLKAYNLASQLIKKELKQKSLQQLQVEFKERELQVPVSILSQVKNKNLPHQYPDTIRRVLEFFGYRNISISKKVLLTFDKPDKTTEELSLKVGHSSNQKVNSSKNDGIRKKPSQRKQDPDQGENE